MKLTALHLLIDYTFVVMVNNHQKKCVTLPAFQKECLPLSP